MLNLFFGNYEANNYIDNPDLFFDNAYKDAWLEDVQSKQMVSDIDHSDLVGPNLVISPVLGSIPINRLSGSVKTLILVSKDPDHVFNASACGDDCTTWLLKIGAEKDVLVRLGHLIICLNTLLPRRHPSSFRVREISSLSVKPLSLSSTAGLRRGRKTT